MFHRKQNSLKKNTTNKKNLIKNETPTGFVTTYCITKTLSQSSLFVCEKDLNFGNQYLKRISAKEIFSCKVSRENNFY